MRKVFRNRGNRGNIDLLYVDLFCGAGGVTSGVVKAKINGVRCAKVLYCVNHDENAIKSHKANHKRTKHSIEDIRTLDLTDLIKTVIYWRSVYPNAKLVLWASLECTHFSKARGGLPRDADSRTLAYSLFRYIEAINPDYIQIENVVEFMSWGPMRIRAKKHYPTYTELSIIKDKKTGEERYGWQPISKLKGADYEEWKAMIQSYGYSYQRRVINCADLGAFTSRKRYFGIFYKHDLPAPYPVQTHFRKPEPGQKRWRAVKKVLDLADHGESIFNRKKALCKKTMQRIYDGLLRYSDEGRFFQLNYTNGGNLNSLENPCPTLPCKDIVSKVELAFMALSYSGGGQLAGLFEPANAITTNPKHNLVNVESMSRYLIMSAQYKNKPTSADNPCPTIIARQDKAPLHLIVTESGELAIEIFPTDCEITVKIKRFMAEHRIADIKMRMLNLMELKRITGFDENYVLVGTQADQKKFIGNAVPVLVAKYWAEELCKALRYERELKLAA